MLGKRVFHYPPPSRRPRRVVEVGSVETGAKLLLTDVIISAINLAKHGENDYQKQHAINFLESEKCARWLSILNIDQGDLLREIKPSLHGLGEF